MVHRMMGLILITVGLVALEAIREEIVFRRRRAALRSRAYQVTGYRGVK